MTLSGAYGDLKIVMLGLIAVAALIAGMRIYQNIQKGEEFEGPALRWFTGLVVAIIFFIAIDALIFNKANIGVSVSAPVMVKNYAAEVYQGALAFGLLVAIIGIVRVYKKFRDGDQDTYDYAIKWFGSLMFLFMIGWIIDLVLMG